MLTAATLHCVGSCPGSVRTQAFPPGVWSSMGSIQSCGPTESEAFERGLTACSEMEPLRPQLPHEDGPRGGSWIHRLLPSVGEGEAGGDPPLLFLCVCGHPPRSGSWGVSNGTTSPGSRVGCTHTPQETPHASHSKPSLTTRGRQRIRSTAPWETAPGEKRKAVSSPRGAQ